MRARERVRDPPSGLCPSSVVFSSLEDAKEQFEVWKKNESQHRSSESKLRGSQVRASLVLISICVSLSC